MTWWVSRDEIGRRWFRSKSSRLDQQKTLSRHNRSRSDRFPACSYARRAHQRRQRRDLSHPNPAASIRVQKIDFIRFEYRLVKTVHPGHLVSNKLQTRNAREHTV